MKKALVMLTICLGLASVAFAEEISELYKEFLRRDSMTLTKEQGRAMSFLRSLKYDIHQIVKMEILDAELGQFVIQCRSGDVCLGDMGTDLLRCKNEMGITTINYVGDAD